MAFFFFFNKMYFQISPLISGSNGSCQDYVEYPVFSSVGQGPFIEMLGLPTLREQIHFFSWFYKALEKTAMVTFSPCSLLKSLYSSAARKNMEVICLSIPTVWVE